MYKLLAITNRHLCKNDFLKQIEDICRFGHRDKRIESLSIVLREKDLPEEEYKILASKVLKICKENNTKCILHTFCKTAIELDCKNIHLPLHILKSPPDILDNFDEIGISIHSLGEAVEAFNLGASYITAGHIFETNCKKDLQPRGLEFLETICSSVNIPVYAIGGINFDNASAAINAGAEGICIMSGLMNCDISNLFN